MRWHHVLRLRLRSLLQRGRVDRDLERELQFHLEQQVDENRTAGMSEEDARFAARRSIGSLAHVQEQCRDARGLRIADDLRRDTSLALRTLGSSPTFTITAVLTLALGIGATTAVYSVVDAAFFRPLPFPQPEQLVRVPALIVPIDMRGLVDAAGGRSGDRPRPKTNIDITDLIAARDVFSRVAAHATGGLNLGTGVEPRRVQATFVTTGFFALFGRSAARGRVFTPEETTPGGRRVAVLSDSLWRAHFGGDSAILGTAIALDGVPHEVVGVMPADFRFPAEAELWVPLPVPVPFSIMGAFRNFLPAQTVARLAPGVTASMAAERLAALRRQYRPSSAAASDPARVVPLQRSLVGDRATALVALMATAGLVLLIACSNVALLLLSRAAVRRREIATHVVMGATRPRILIRLLVESLLLAAGGTMLGLGVASGSMAMLSALMPPPLSGLAPPQLDLRLLLFAAGAMLATSITFGFLPAVRGASGHPAEALSDGGRAQTGSGRLNRVIVVGQVGMACLLVIVSGLMLSSLRSLLGVDLGMRLHGVASARLNLPSVEYEGPRLSGFVQDVVTRLGDTRNVAAAAAINTLPLSDEVGISLAIRAEGTPPEPGEPAHIAPYLVVSPHYFATMGIPLLAGRDFTWRDNKALPVAIINQTLARQLWPTGSALGKRFEWPGGLRTIVGVVGDARILDPGTPVGAQVYIPIQEQPQGYLSLVARSTDGDGHEILPLFRDAVRALAPSLPVYAVAPMDGVISELLAARRTSTIVVAVFGLLALSLSALGVYGVLAYSVAQRRREIGIRVALGAGRGALVTSVVRQGVTLAVIGIALGLAAAAATTHYVQSLLYGIAPRDPLTFGVAALLLVVTAAAAACLPARAAARLDPLTALRLE